MHARAYLTIASGGYKSGYSSSVYSLTSSTPPLRNLFKLVLITAAFDQSRTLSPFCPEK